MQKIIEESRAEIPKGSDEETGPSGPSKRKKRIIESSDSSESSDDEVSEKVGPSCPDDERPRTESIKKTNSYTYEGNASSDIIADDRGKKASEILGNIFNSPTVPTVSTGVKRTPFSPVLKTPFKTLAVPRPSNNG